MATIVLGRYLCGSSERYHECVEACVARLVACEMCSDACLDEGDVAMMKACIRLDRDCVDASIAAARAMSRGGPLAETVRVAVSLTKAPTGPAPAIDIDTAGVAQAHGHSGRANGGVYQVMRRDPMRSGTVACRSRD